MQRHLMGIALASMMVVAASRAAAQSCDDPRGACESIAAAQGAGVEEIALACFDATRGAARRVFSRGTLNDPLGTLLVATRSTVVVVLHDPAFGVAIKQGGTVGISLPTTRTDDAPPMSPGTHAAPAPSAACTTTVVIFAPRTSGDAAITVTVTPPPPAAGAAPPPTISVSEAYVPPVYSGVLRLGIGAISVDGLRHAYGRRKQLAGELEEVVDRGGSRATYEIVVGYAPFLLPRLEGYAGRTFTSSDPSRWRLSPYLGIGALSASSSGVDWLRSIYLGVELELAQGCSVAITGVGRRVDTLAKGLEVGTVVAKDTAVTRTAFDYGWGLVFNFTPDFFTFAASAIPK